MAPNLELTSIYVLLFLSYLFLVRFRLLSEGRIAPGLRNIDWAQTWTAVGQHAPLPWTKMLPAGRHVTLRPGGRLHANPRLANPHRECAASRRPFRPNNSRAELRPFNRMPPKTEANHPEDVRGRRLLLLLLHLFRRMNHRLCLQSVNRIYRRKYHCPLCPRRTSGS